jgi:hypothetical protein
MSTRHFAAVFTALFVAGLVGTSGALAQEDKQADPPAASKDNDVPVKNKGAAAEEEDASAAKVKDAAATRKKDAAAVQKNVAAAKGKEASVQGSEPAAKDKNAAGTTKDRAAKDKVASEKLKDGASRDKDAPAKDKTAIAKDKDSAAAKWKEEVLKDKHTAAKDKPAAVKGKEIVTAKERVAAAKAKGGKVAAAVKGSVKSIDLEGKAITLDVPSEKDGDTTVQTFKFGPDLRVMVLGQESASAADIQPGMRVAVILTEEKTVMGIKAMVKGQQADIKKNKPAGDAKGPGSKQDQPVKTSDKVPPK